MSRYDEYMPSKKYVKDLKTNVDKRSRLIHISNFCYKNLEAFSNIKKRVLVILLSFLTCALLIETPAVVFSLKSISILNSQSAYAENITQNSGIVATDSITDTENLLGDSITKVSDAITATKKRTGVTVKLLYLSTFGNTKNPSKWASDLLISTLPAKNTVLLAVATNDGRLVVAVSSNSDEWLKNKNTVNALSDAAYKPLVTNTGANWGKSAIMLMKQIAISKRTATTTSASLISTIIMLIILILLCALVTIILLRRKYIQRQINSGRRKARRRHAQRR